MTSRRFHRWYDSLEEPWRFLLLAAGLVAVLSLQFVGRYGIFLVVAALLVAIRDRRRFLRGGK